MKKSLTAVAVLAAIALPFIAHAGDEAEIYGKLNVSADYVDNAIDGADALDSFYVVTSSSRIGLKGSRDLNSGLKASWKVENDIYFGRNTDSLGGKWGSRDTYVALSGSFGTLVLGRHNTPFKNARSKVDLFKEQPGDSRNIAKLKIKGKSRGWDERGDGILYKTPSFNGITLYAQAEPGNGGAIPLVSTSAVYKVDKLFASIAYEVHNTAPENEAGIRAAAKYSMGAIGIAGFYQQISDQNGVAGETRNSIGGGATYTMEDTTIKAQYLASGDTDFDADSDGSVLALGVDQKLGKMTTAYLTYAMSMNGDNAQFVAAGDGGHDTGGRIAAQAEGDNQVVIALGMIHAF